MKKIMVAVMTFVMAVSFISCTDDTPVNISNSDFVEIPWKNIKMLKTEVTQELYEAVMGENPSSSKGNDLPVESVSWFDCVVFCNKLSKKQNLVPCYSYKGSTDVSRWKFLKEKTGEWVKKAGKWGQFNKDFTCNFKASGYRLPTEEEWMYAAGGFEDHTFPGGEKHDEVGWYKDNSQYKTHSVAQKKANSYGLYDMGGNVSEWLWDPWFLDNGSEHRVCGDNYDSVTKDGFYNGYGGRDSKNTNKGYNTIGFRLVCKSSITDSKESIPKIEMVEIPGMNIKMLNTEVTQKLYKFVMERNPSSFKGVDLPVESVSWYDAIYFCNKMSEKFGLEPVYSVSGKTDVTKWNYYPHNYNWIDDRDIEKNVNASGFRLPTKEEWWYAEQGGENYKYPGSDNRDEVGWYDGNSDNKTHPVAQKKPNAYGLYDMFGNVEEWVWDSCRSINFGGSYSKDKDARYRYGGSFIDYGMGGSIEKANLRDSKHGFRIVCTSSIQN